MPSIGNEREQTTGITFYTLKVVNIFRIVKFHCRIWNKREKWIPINTNMSISIAGSGCMA